MNYATSCRLLALVALLQPSLGSFAGADPTASPADEEAIIGQKVYTELQQKGEILSNSPYAAELAPIAHRIAAVADPQYEYPFTFYIVHEAQPNAFAVPGGHVYVTDALFKFVKTKEELAGVLCHETSHDIHHDVINNERKDNAVYIGAALLAYLFGKGQNRIVDVILGLGAAETRLHFSREVEENADLKGSDTCAAAGYNPYGMIWLFERFASDQDLKSPPEFLSDHPNDKSRINHLLHHFRAHPEVFGKFDPDPRSGTPLQ